LEPPLPGSNPGTPAIKISGMKMFFIYVLQSDKDKKYYIGQTRYLTDRLEKHSAGRVPATKKRIPLTLVYSEELQTRSEAVQRERYLKGLNFNKIFKKIIGAQI
jgi:putative endonuclease